MLPTQIAQRDPSLTAMALEYKPKELVLDRLGPMLESDNRRIQYVKLDKLNMFQDVDHRFSRDGEANEVGAGGTKVIEALSNRALKTTINKEDIEDSDDFFDVAAIQVETMRHTLALQREKEQAALIVSSLNTASRAIDPGNWGDLSASFVDVFGQVRTAQEAAWVPYDGAIVPIQVLYKLQRHPSLLSQYFDGNSGRKTVTLDGLKELFGVSDIIVPEARIATQRRPQSAPADLSTIPYVFGNNVVLFRKAVGQPSRALPGFYYQWRRRWLKGVVGENMQVRTWDLPNKGIGGSYVVQQEYQVKHMVFPEMGYMFKDVLT